MDGYSQSGVYQKVNSCGQNGDYDVAARDVNMALAAYALARSEGSREKEAKDKDWEDEAIKNVA